MMSVNGDDGKRRFELNMPLLLVLVQLINIATAAARPLGFINPSYLAKNHGFPKPSMPLPSGIPCYPTQSTSLFSSVEELQQITHDVVEQYELHNRFERWSFLQKLLENEIPLKDVENSILAALNGYLLHGPRVGDAPEDADVRPQSNDDDNEGLPSPVLNDELRQSMETLIDDILCIRLDNEDTDSRFLHLFVEPPIDYELEVLMGTLMKKTSDVTPTTTNDIHPKALSLVNRIEQLLPDPVEEEEAYKGAWDIVIDLYGREGVRVREEAIQRNGVNGDANRENLSWKTLCCIGRVLIHYDFLTKGILCG